MQAAARLAHRPSADGVASTHDKGEGRVCVSERTLVLVAWWFGLYEGARARVSRDAAPLLLEGKRAASKHARDESFFVD